MLGWRARAMSVSILMVRALVEAVERAGVPGAKLLEAAGVAPETLDDLHARMSLSQYDRVSRLALELSDDPALGLHLVDRSSPPAFDPLSHMSAHAETLREAIEGILRYSRLFSVEPAGSLHEEGDVASVRYAFPRLAWPSVYMGAELTLCGFARLLSTFAGADARPRAVCFGYEAPAHRAEYARIFGGSERFGQPYTGIDFERAWLDRTQLHKNAELHSALRAQAERSLGRLERVGRVTERVLDHLLAADPRHPPAMTAVARELGMSARSLRRKLEAEGADFKRLSERARTRIALRMLEAPEASIQEVAFAMGFATAAAFHRAFKRWTGKTPKQHRATF